MQWADCTCLAHYNARCRDRTFTISDKAAISAEVKAANWQVLLALLATMDQAAMEPNTMSYKAAISACRRKLSGRMRLFC